MNNSFLELKNTNICVEFSVLGNDFDPNIITKRLNVNPDSIHIKGEPIKGRNNLNYKETDWSISTGYCESLSVEAQLKEILNILKPQKKNLLILSKELDIMYKIFIVVNIKNNRTPSVYLEREVIRFLASIDAEIDYDMYVYS